MRSTFKILFYLKKNAPKPDGSIPIMCRISIDGSIAQFSCKISVLLDLWDMKANKAKGKSKEAQVVNAMLDKMRMGINNCYQKAMLKEGFTTANKIKNAYLGLDVKEHTLMALFESHNKELAQKVGITRSKKTYEVHVSVYNNLSRFLPKYYKRNDIFLKELEATFVKDFEQYLRIERKCSTNGINCYMTTLKHIVSKACSSGVLHTNPISSYKAKHIQKDRGFLNNEELQLIMNVKFKKASHELIRDLFIFSVFTGLSYIDVKNLTPDKIRKSFDGHIWIETKRQKTNTPSNVRLLEVPKRILEKYKGLSRDGKVFPVPSNRQCNNILRKIGLDCGIKTKLTYHVSRHTMATTICLSKGVPIETVSRILGHTNIRTTQIYAKITNQKISQDMEVLSHKLESFEEQIIKQI